MNETTPNPNEPGDGMEEIEDDLAKALPRLSSEQIAGISPKFVRETYANGQEILRQGEPPDKFFIVIDGMVEIVHENLAGEVEVIDSCGPGNYFGEIGLLQNRPRSATVRAPRDGKVELVSLSREDFGALIDESRATEMQVALEMTQRLIRLANAQ